MKRATNRRHVVAISLCWAMLGWLLVPASPALGKKPPHAGGGKIKAPKTQGGKIKAPKTQGGQFKHSGGGQFKQPGGGQHKHPGGGHYKSHGRFQLSVTPYGIGYGYIGRHFGIQIGPLFPVDYGPYYQPPYFAELPAYDALPPVIESQPLVDQAQRPIVATNERAAGYQSAAEQAFRQQRYEDALKQAAHAIVEDGRNGKLHLFTSQCLFALGDYRNAAVAIYQGVSILEQDDWGFVVKNHRHFYTNADYEKQMEQLVEYLREQPDAAYARLVRGYHYAFLGHDDAARVQLTKVIDLEPRDEVAKKLLDLLGDKPAVRAPQPVEDDEELPQPEDAGGENDDRQQRE